VLLYDFNDPVGPRVDQDGSIIDHRITVIPDAIFDGDIVIGYTSFRQFCPDPNVAPIDVRRPVLLYDIVLKSRSLIRTEQASDASDDTADCSANDGPNGPSSSIALASPAFDATRDALG
jgi:hypothetical protein